MYLNGEPLLGYIKSQGPSCLLFRTHLSVTLPVTWASSCYASEFCKWKEFGLTLRRLFPGISIVNMGAGLEERDIVSSELTPRIWSVRRFEFRIELSRGLEAEEVPDRRAL
jgi:hypothetical protein